MHTGAAEAGRIALVDAARGIAAFGVFVFHVSGAALFPKRVLPPVELFSRTFDNIPSPLTFGATGVSCFFVISGFCLALKPAAPGAPTLDLRRYARDRVARVYPAYAVAVLASCLVATWLGQAFDMAELAAVLAFLQGLIQRWVFSYNGALWSMATEVQFYLLFPLLAMLMLKLRGIAFVTLAAALAIAWRFAAAHAPGHEVVEGGITRSAMWMNLVPGRLLEFALGMVLALAWWRDRAALGRWSILLTPVIIPLALIARMKGPLWLADPMMGLMYAVIVGWLVSRRWALPARHPLAGFGRASYSFFLIHFPIISLLVAYWPALAGMAAWPRFFSLLAASFALALPAALLLYRGVEAPLWARWRSRRGDAPQAPVPAMEVP